MNSRQAMLITVGLCIGGLISSVWGTVLRPAKAETTPASERVRPLEQARGPVVSIDPAAGHLVLKGDRGWSDLRVDGSTTIFVHGRTGKLSDLAVGDVVCATYEPGVKHSAPLAQWIEVCERLAAPRKRW